MKFPSDITKALDIAVGHLRGDDIAAYIDSGLTSDERQAVDLHLTACSACREQLAMVTEAVEADIANPARIDALAERLAETATAKSRPRRAMLGGLPSRVRASVRAAAERTRDYIGSLSTWSFNPAAEGAAMLAGGSPVAVRYHGVEIRLDELFAQEVLAEELRWARGSLSLTAACDEAGKVSDLRAAVGVGSVVELVSPIIVRVGPPGGAGVTLTLTQDRPASVAAGTPLEGPLVHMTVTVSVGR